MGKPDVTGGQLAQAAGCDPTNPCHFECAEAWRSTLEQWDTLADWERTNILAYAEWIAKQTWV